VSHSQAVLLICLGGLGLVEFGVLWLAVKWLDANLVEQSKGDWLGGIIGPTRRRRVDRWVHVSPLLAAVSIALVTAGAMMRWAIVP
jgi:hypothetical protein